MKKDKKEKKEKKEKRASIPRLETALSNPGTDSGLPPQDPLEYALARIGGKWKLRILWGLGQVPENGGLRYGDLKEKIPGITDMMFSQSLKDLAAEGFIQRTQFQQIPPRVEYALTPEGISLLPVIAALYDWAVKQMKK